MADQQIKDSGASIKNVVPAQWQKGQCPPAWAEPTVLIFSDVGLEFADSSLIAFKDFQ